MSNVKAGDLAIVVRAENWPWTIGMIVDVMREVAAPVDMPDGTGIMGLPAASPPHFLVKFVGGSVKGKLRGGGTYRAGYAIYSRSGLKPLPGDESTTTTEREEMA